MNLHCGTGSPNYGRFASVPMIMITEVAFYGMRPFVHMLLSGVFERFPRLKFVITEGSAAGVRPTRCSSSTAIIASVRKGEIGELKYTDENALPRSATEYFQQNVLGRRELPRPGRRRGPQVHAARTGSCGAATTRTTRAPGPTPVSTCARCSTTSPRTSCATSSAATPPKLYDFDLDALAPLAAAVRADGRGARDSRSTPCPTTPNEALLRVKRQQDERAA